jgi:hypothetical protein
MASDGGEIVVDVAEERNAKGGVGVSLAMI